MTTNITELAQSLKAAAEKWQEAWGKYDKVEITIAEFIRAAEQYESIVKDPANVLALVEALENSESRLHEVAVACATAEQALEKAQQRNGELETYSKTAIEFREAARDENRHLKLELEIAEKRIAELEREQEQLRPVGVMSEQAFHRLENRECRFIALWPRPGIFLQRKRPEDGVIVYARTAAAAGIKVEDE
ncbi:ead/Ea22-like family protein [Klebsiella quasipneumoniae]|uniref:ead/Ea22-like family protein n=1 Tax=Klebsiella quasipneumoniae TaxID=1463165 RepID=UPI0038D187B9|nr:ead/Ea22-like family protein [Klebsiella quasipneumoniae]